MSLRQLIPVVVAGASLCVQAAPDITLLIDSGTVNTYQASSWSRTSLATGSQMGPGDTIFLQDRAEAALRLSPTSALLLTDSCILAIGGTAQAPRLELLKGQLFLDRSGQDDLTIGALGCSFTPLGTRAAVRLAKNQQPSVAVLKGSMRAADPAGQAMEVAAGDYATFDPEVRGFKKGALSEPAREKLDSQAAALERLGSTAAAAAPATETQGATQPATSPEVVESSPSLPPPVAPVSQGSVATGTKPVAAEQTTTPPPARVQESTPPPPSGPVEQVSTRDAPASDEKPEEKEPDGDKEEKPDRSSATSPSGGGMVRELSASYVTVDDKQWMRIAFFMDIPIWRFGIGLDVELFLDEQGQPSNKGWDFRNDPVDAIFRKVRYLRFNREQDKLFAKFGGLDRVTFGYGFVVDNFTNMLNYPSEKLLGLQFYLNDISPLGITLQTMVADFKDFGNDGGVLAGRLAIRPLGMTGVPLVNKLSVGGTYATDLNQFAPARDWDYTLRGSRWDRDQDDITDSTFFHDKFGTTDYYTELRSDQIAAGDFDTVIEHQEQWASRRTDAMSVVGADAGIPLIASKLLNLTVYGQAAMTYDDHDGNRARGWGIGAPGALLGVGPLSAKVEYRRIQGEFMPGYFNTYYLSERIRREPFIRAKEAMLIDQTLNGVFGSLGFNIANLLTVTGTYQCLISQDTTPLEERPLDQRFEAVAAIGEMLIEKIPKAKKAEAFIYKTNIKRTDMDPLTPELDKDAFFQFTPYMYWGFRAGVEVLPNTAVIWESRYGKMFDESGRLVDDNQIIISAAMTF